VTRTRTLMLVSSYFPPHIGGVETYVDSLARAVSALPGWRVVVVTTGSQQGMRVTEEAGGLRVYRLPCRFRAFYTPLDPRWPRQLRRILHAERPDHLNVHTPVPGLADTAALVAGRTPLVVTYHAATLRKPGQGLFNLLAGVYGIAEAQMMRRARLVLGVSDHVADVLRCRHGDKVAVLRNAVDMAATADLPPSHDPRFHIVFVARLDPSHAWKGLDLLLAAVRSYTARFGESVRVLVVGDGDDRARYEAVARELGITRNVTFAGTLTGQAKFAAIRSARALVTCPTSANDAFPTVMLEAWGSGVAVVAAAVGPLVSLVEDGVTGLLVPPGRPDALADAIHRIVTCPAMARALGDAGQARVRADFTWQQRAREFVGMLEQRGSHRAAGRLRTLR
jgi:glycosyltransferase involved in cell wall biosynthesis